MLLTIDCENDAALTSDKPKGINSKNYIIKPSAI